VIFSSPTLTFPVGVTSSSCSSTCVVKQLLKLYLQVANLKLNSPSKLSSRETGMTAGVTRFKFCQWSQPEPATASGHLRLPCPGQWHRDSDCHGHCTQAGGSLSATGSGPARARAGTGTGSAVPATLTNLKTTRMEKVTRSFKQYYASLRLRLPVSGALAGARCQIE